ncbi:hypothetical protein, partial [Fischerella thermalis]|uniref:hypothetical protein n=1 Tax=Fischerella thermalis TaxID=372787 RepID=UPI001CA476DA
LPSWRSPSRWQGGEPGGWFIIHPHFMQRPGINPYLLTSCKLTQQPPSKTTIKFISLLQVDLNY